MKLCVYSYYLILQYEGKMAKIGMHILTHKLLLI